MQHGAQEARRLLVAVTSNAVYYLSFFLEGPQGIIAAAGKS
jgi:hypothetical protein